MKKKALIIVESPAKIKTLRKFLGSDYLFESSIGHIIDLPAKKFGIDLENNFTPEYEILEGKKKVVTALKKAAKEVETVYLSPDPDREGEAIAWHIASILPKNTPYKRITFNEITKEAVKTAIKKPRDIDMDLVDAQQARRFLDRMVGYKISPILHQKIRRSTHTLSAGRVQSVALLIVVTREREIEAFIPIEYWNLFAHLNKGKETLVSTLHSVNDLRVEKEETEKKKVYLINNEKTAKNVKDALDKSTYTITKIDKKERKRRPAPPFITSTLQQEASRHYRFSSKKTMMLAQNLYEGIDMGEGSEGLITYMRTDSVRISNEAASVCRPHISLIYGDQYLPAKSPLYGSKKAAQDAHEAIRPTNFEKSPEKVEQFLSSDQFKLYSLIWKRFFASQMKDAIYDTVSVDIDAMPKGHKDKSIKNMNMRLTGSNIKFKGFLIAYQEKTDHEVSEKDTILPPLKVGEKLPLEKIEATQSFTKPPARFTEASLVKELERSGIGRPSTYAAIMNKIQSRAYTIKEKGTLIPTDLGKVICQMLEENFTHVMDIKFTAEMEQKLDEIAESKADWKKFLAKFWDKFKIEVDKAKKEATVPKIATDLDCPKCKKNKLNKVFANDKYFYGCSGYPDCDYSAPIEGEKEIDKSEYADDFDWDQKCPKCDGEMKVRTSRFGHFLGCAAYPKCKTIINIPKKGEVQIKNLPKCPAKGCDGDIVQRKSRYGKTFFSCSNFPDCNVIANSVEEVQEKYKDHQKTAYEKKGRGKAAGGNKRTSPFLNVSDALKAIVGEKELTRGEITKKLWVYIKENNLQDENNKRLIVPDEKMAKFFGNKEPLDMMQLARCISNNIIK
ncbi:MAG: DNA topoisomerase 1 [Chlamydiia bacterium]|nr:DNA topoisomerase 1 [Chlamydiia bacterium]